MPTPHPSRMTPHPPRPKGIPKDEWGYCTEYEREAEKVDKRLTQQAKAREAKAAKDARRKRVADRKRREAQDKEWAELISGLNLSPRQETLARAIHQRYPSKLQISEAIMTLYREEWADLNKWERRQFSGRLRRFQYAINLKLQAIDYQLRLTIENGNIFFVDLEQWKRRRPVRPAQRPTTAPGKSDSDRKSEVARCAKLLRCLFKDESLLKHGWLPVGTLNESARLAGFGPSTIRNARKRLRLIPKTVGIGPTQESFVCLPTRKTAKRNR